MSSKRLRQLRQRAYEKQMHRCFYCSYLMWDGDSENFSRIHQLPTRFAKYLQCTAEHMLARRDDGRDSVNNVVAACLWCNRMRHRGRQHKAPDALTYKEQASRLVALGRWHPLAASGRGYPLLREARVV